MLITKAAAKKYNISVLAKVLKIYFHISVKNQSPFFMDCKYKLINQNKQTLFHFTLTFYINSILLIIVEVLWFKREIVLNCCG